MKLTLKSILLLYVINFLVFFSISYAENKQTVARAIFTTEIIDREPVDQILVLKNTAKSISFFTDLRHFEGQTITHKWIYNNKTESVVKFEVKGPRWRVYSRLSLNPSLLGKWSVVVQNESGRALKASVFRLVDQQSEQVILPKVE